MVVESFIWLVLFDFIPILTFWHLVFFILDFNFDCIWFLDLFPYKEKKRKAKEKMKVKAQKKKNGYWKNCLSLAPDRSGLEISGETAEGLGVI